MYRLAATLDPGLLPAAGHGDLRRDGAGRHHDGRRVPLPPPRPGGSPTTTRTRWATRCVAAAADGRRAADAARHVLPPRRDRRGRPTRCSSASPTATPSAWAERASRRGARRPRVRIGAAVHSVRAVDAGGDGGRGAWADERGRAAARPRQRAAGRERGLRSPPTAGRPSRCWPTAGAARRAVHRRPRHPPHRRRHHARSAARLASASARRPSGTWPTASARRPRCVAAGARLCLGSRLARGDRPVRGGPGRRARRAAGHRRRGHHTAAELLAAATAGGARSLGWADAGHLAVGALADLDRRRPRQRPPGRRRARRTSSRRRCSPRARPTCAT